MENLNTITQIQRSEEEETEKMSMETQPSEKTMFQEEESGRQQPTSQMPLFVIGDKASLQRANSIGASKRKAVESPEKGQQELEMTALEDLNEARKRISAWCDDKNNKCNAGFKRRVEAIMEETSQVMYRVLIENASLRGKNQELERQVRRMEERPIPQTGRTYAVVAATHKKGYDFPRQRNAAVQRNQTNRPSPIDQTEKLRRRKEEENGNAGLNKRIQEVSRKKQKAYTVIVEGKKGQKASDIKIQLMREIDPRTEGIHIKAVRQTRTEKLVIETTSEVEAEKLKANKVFRTEELNARAPIRRGPRILIYDVPKDVTNEALGESILEQNMERLQEAGIDKTVFVEGFKPIYEMGKREQDRVHHVAEVTPAVRSGLLKIRKVFIGWMSCKMVDHVTISQCYNCQSFGHIASKCPQEGPTCWMWHLRKGRARDESMSLTRRWELL